MPALFCVCWFAPLPTAQTSASSGDEPDGAPRWLRHGNADGEVRAVTSLLRAAANVYGASQLLDDIARDPQSDAESLFTLGGHKRLEDFFQLLRRDARAGVGEDQLHVLSIGDDVERDRSAKRHGVDGVGDKIGEYLTQFAGKDIDHRIGLVVPLHLNMRLLKRAVERLQRGFNQI